MTADALRKHLKSKYQFYTELASVCGSVSELLFRIAVYGDRWSKWDWVLFLGNMGALRKNPDLFEDILNVVDAGSDLDPVMTNKTVVMAFIDYLGENVFSGAAAVRLLAHVFRKFPSLWTMNWMFIRPRGKKPSRRIHRMETFLQPASLSPEDISAYVGSDRARLDFISAYADCAV